MCYNLSAKKRIQALQKKYGIKLSKGFNEHGYYQVSGFSHPKLTVITQENPKEFEEKQWGLIRSWTKNEEEANIFQDRLLNIRAEKIFEKPTSRDIIMRKRCILPVDGFYEWQTIAKAKYPYYIFPKDKDELFTLGCIYDTWTNKETGEIINTFSIVTTKANEIMAMIHNTKKRMPLILSDEGWHKWIDPKATKEEIEALLIPSPNEILRYHTISKDISYKDRDSNYPEIRNEVIYPTIKGENDLFSK